MQMLDFEDFFFPANQCIRHVLLPMAVDAMKYSLLKPTFSSYRVV